jgi:hypothetical protein
VKECDKVCHKCHKKGHIKKNCPKFNNVSSSCFVHCYVLSHNAKGVHAKFCESSRPLSDVLIINDNCLWTNGSWRNKNAWLDHIELEILEIYKHWLWIK